ncbi:MAG: hypothetical protein ACRCZ3_10075 [Providencia rustigianii]|uniref:hypothetical protein n=1 Tax=Providencia rustigianii TaxID=158850 RepID=UPI003F30BEDC
MFNSIKVNEKFDQSKIIQHYKNTIKNEFSRKIIGIDNMKKLEDGLCYGLTHLFLRYAHANYERTFVTEFYREIKLAKNKGKLTDKSNSFINKLFHSASKIQLLSDRIINIHNTRCDFSYPPQNHNETIENYLIRILKINIIQSSSHKLSSTDSLKFYELTMQLYFYTYFPNLRKNLLKDKMPFEIDCIKEHSKQVKQKCSNHYQNNLSANSIESFFKLSECFQTSLLKKILENKNKKYGIFYEPYRSAKKISEYSYNEKMTLKQFKQKIDLRLKRKQDTISDFSSQFHAMGIAIKHLDGVPIFEFFEPNKGLVITTEKEKFFRVLDKVSNNYTFLKNKSGEKVIDANISYADKLHQYPLSDKIKEPKLTNHKNTKGLL